MYLNNRNLSRRTILRGMGVGITVPLLDAMLPARACSGEPRTVGDMAASLSRAFGADSPEVVGGYRLGDVRHVVASPERAARTLGFRASVPFDDGMREFASAELR